MQRKTLGAADIPCLHRIHEFLEKQEYPNNNDFNWLGCIIADLEESRKPEASDIIAHSPWFNRGNGMALARLVLRLVKNKKELVIHTQYHYSDGARAFGDGIYFLVRDDEAAIAHKAAIAKFNAKFSEWVSHYPLYLDPLPPAATPIRLPTLAEGIAFANSVLPPDSPD